jgi:hypothetical protein
MGHDKQVFLYQGKHSKSWGETNELFLLGCSKLLAHGEVAVGCDGDVDPVDALEVATGHSIPLSAIANGEGDLKP